MRGARLPRPLNSCRAAGLSPEPTKEARGEPEQAAVEMATGSSISSGKQQQQLWGHKHLPLLVGASSKDSVEYILQALWRTRNTGLDSADRSTFRDILHLSSDSDLDLDPLLVCLRVLIRRCVYENTPKEEIQKLFPQDVLPELQKLLTLLLQKFQSEWKDDVLKDQVDKEGLLGETGGNFVNLEGDQASNNEETNNSAERAVDR